MLLLDPFMSLPLPHTSLVKIFSDRLPNLCHRCDTEGQNNLVYAQRIPIDLGADPLSLDRIVGVFGIFDRTIGNLLCNWEVRRVVFPIVLRSASNRVNCEVRRVVFPIVLRSSITST